MHVSFSIPAKPFSINQMSYRSKAIKTKEARAWEQSIFKCLKSKEIQEKLTIIRENFKPNDHCFSVQLTFYYPLEHYYNSGGAISARTIDLSNCEKPLLDLIFLSKYHESPNSAFIKNLNTDDRYIASLKSKKKPAEEHKISIKIAIVPLYNSAVYPK